MVYMIYIKLLNAFMYHSLTHQPSGPPNTCHQTVQGWGKSKTYVDTATMQGVSLCVHHLANSTEIFGEHFSVRKKSSLKWNGKWTEKITPKLKKNKPQQHLPSKSQFWLQKMCSFSRVCSCKIRGSGWKRKSTNPPQETSHFSDGSFCAVIRDW